MIHGVPQEGPPHPLFGIGDLRGGCGYSNLLFPCAYGRWKQDHRKCLMWMRSLSSSALLLTVVVDVDLDFSGKVKCRCAGGKDKDGGEF